jgi:hypothetical protein
MEILEYIRSIPKQISSTGALLEPFRFKAIYHFIVKEVFDFPS